jgi:hypothetical protein
VGRELDKVSWINLLHDFYGQLLTERQRDFVELYYGRDLSLGEIAGDLQISRQAVYDAIKRAEHILNEYERKMGLVQKFIVERKKLAEAQMLLRDCQVDGDCNKVARARELLAEVLEMD